MAGRTNSGYLPNPARLVLLALVGCALLAGPPSAQAAQAAPAYVPDRLVVGFEQGTGPSKRAALRRSEDLKAVQALPIANTQVVRIERGGSVKGIARRLERRAGVRYAEPDYIVRPDMVPNDPRFEQQWGQNNTGQTIFNPETPPTFTPTAKAGTPGIDIDAPQAWDITTGDASVTVGIVDTGAALDVPDLAGRRWANPGETGGGKESNGIDDDNNGYVDDWGGWNMEGNSNDVSDNCGHGTHVSGIVGANGNDGVGVAGVDWHARLMPVKGLEFHWPHCEGAESKISAGLVYAADNGAKIVNASLGTPFFTQPMYDAIAAHPNTLFVTSAGNGGENVVSDNVEAHPNYPCSFTLPNIICVGAIDSNDKLTYFSNYGSKTVDLMAPGMSVLSTLPSVAWGGGGYGYWAGTSMATPFVTGTAALLAARYPTATTEQLKAMILDSVVPEPGLKTKSVTGGRLNAYNALTSRNSVSVRGAALSVRAGISNDDDVSVVQSAVIKPEGLRIRYTVQAQSAIESHGSECSNTAATTVVCDTLGIQSVDVATGSGNDDVDTSQVNVPVSIDSGAGNDTLIGTGGNDSLAGGAGDDVLNGGLGADTLAGGDGRDTADYSSRSESLTISIDSSANDGAGGEKDRVSTDIEIVTGGSGNDAINGSSADDDLRGGPGNDTVLGRGGNDQLAGAAGNDDLTGGPGADGIVCGDNSDIARADSLDQVASDCEVVKR